MPQPETPTARTPAEDIPTSVTQLVYTAPPIDENHNGKPLHLSQNKTAELLAHYWPAIEAHFRDRIAVEQRAFHAEQNRSIPCAGPGCLVHEVINHIAVSAPGGAPAAPACRCGADPVHQMGCDAEWADQ